MNRLNKSLAISWVFMALLFIIGYIIYYKNNVNNNYANVSAFSKSIAKPQQSKHETAGVHHHVVKSGLVTANSISKNIASKDPLPGPKIIHTNSHPEVRTALNKSSTNISSQAVTIYFDNYGFDPNELTVPMGTVVEVKNISTLGALNFQPLYGQSNQNYALSLGLIGEGQSKSFVVAKKGVWQYEGDNNPSLRGEIGEGDGSSYNYQQNPNATITSKSLTLEYNDYGFIPNEITVPLGTKITFYNLTTNTQPGPMLFKQVPNQPSNNPALNLGVIYKQQHKSFIASSVGSWQFEDAYQPAAKGIGQLTVN